jgi:glycosyltransferase involved in cell wall biosynthesis
VRTSSTYSWLHLLKSWSLIKAQGGSLGQNLQQFPEAEQMRAICLEKRWNHHAQISGYDRLSDYLDARTLSRPNLGGLGGKVMSKVYEMLHGDRKHLFDYTLADRLAEERAYWLACATRTQIVHVLYGDEQLNTLLHRQPFMPGHLVATFHLPAERTRERFERVQQRELQRLSGAIVVASNEVPAFAAWLGEDKVMYVPHGIDTRAFTAGPGNPESTLRLAFVGLHMRDFEVAHRVADCCARDGLDVMFDVVLPARHLGFFTGCDNVRRHSGVSDAALTDVYRHADALFLPVTGATANNAVLEALACGTPVISTYTGGIPDYVDESSGWLLPLGDAEAAYACVQRLALNRDEARGLRAGARAKAETFSWHRVAAQITGGYQRLLAGQSFAG